MASGVCYGASDVKCSMQALESAARDLLKVLPKHLPIICSPLSRCEHLAHILCRLQADFAYKTDEKLTEMHFGGWEMCAWDAIAQSQLSAWTDDFAAYRCGGSGESTGQFVQRVAQRLHQSAQGGGDQIWITHAGVIRAMQWLAVQPFELFAALATGQAHQFDHAPLLSPLRAADWPTGEVAFGQLHLAHQRQPWGWPLAWPSLPLWPSAWESPQR